MSEVEFEKSFLENFKVEFEWVFLEKFFVFEIGEFFNFLANFSQVEMGIDKAWRINVAISNFAKWQAIFVEGQRMTAQ